MNQVLRIGTRGSQLALWQAHWVQKAIVRAKPDVRVDVEIIKTKGDKIQDVPLAKVGGKGLFVKEIEEALLDGRVDLAVHSMKDMPADLPPGLCIGAVPKRANPLDALVSNRYASLDKLPDGARVGTSSLRRSAQLLNLRPDLEIVPLRGNLDTRLKKLDSGVMDAIILAAAGLERLGLQDRIAALIPATVMLPAVGQGALCIESRRDDTALAAILDDLEDSETRVAVTAERGFLKRLEGGCQVPIAGHAQVTANQVHLSGLVAELNGSRIIRAMKTRPGSEAETLGVETAEELLANGADDILTRLQHYVH